MPAEPALVSQSGCRNLLAMIRQHQKGQIPSETQVAGTHRAAGTREGKPLRRRTRDCIYRSRSLRRNRLSSSARAPGRNRPEGGCAQELAQRKPAFYPKRHKSCFHGFLLRWRSENFLTQKLKFLTKFLYAFAKILSATAESPTAKSGTRGRGYTRAAGTRVGRPLRRRTREQTCNTIFLQVKSAASSDCVTN